MSAEPLVLYSFKIDPSGVLRLLRKLSPNLHVTGPDADWQTATIARPKRLFHRAWQLSFTHNSDYYGGSDWAAQMRGMQNYFGQFPANENLPLIMLLIDSFRFALSVNPPPQPDLHLGSRDERLSIVFAVAKHLDAAIFTPSAMRDASGRVLFGASEPDRRAVMPAIYKSVPVTPRSERPGSEHGTVPNADDSPPPTPLRVARRALSLAAVTGRALLEDEIKSGLDVEKVRQQILAWVEEIGIGDELEPDEWEILQLPCGNLPAQDALNAKWRLEGLGIIAWALLRGEALAHDQLVDPHNVMGRLGFLDSEVSRQLMADPTLRSHEDLAKRREQIFAVNWRLTDWRLSRAKRDFQEFANTAWFGPLDLTELNLLENDLAIGNKPLHRAAADAVRTATSAAIERHLAINWLVGGSELYSETDVST